MHSKHVSCGDPNPSMDIIRDVSKVLDFPDKKSFLQVTLQVFSFNKPSDSYYCICPIVQLNDSVPCLALQS